MTVLQFKPRYQHRPYTAQGAPRGPVPQDPRQWPSAFPFAPWAALGEGHSMDFPTQEHPRPKVQRAAHAWGRWLGVIFQVSVLRRSCGTQVARVTRVK